MLVVWIMNWRKLKLNKNSLIVNKICLAAMFLCLGWLLPFITAQNTQLGNVISPMHIAIYLCGFVLGPVYGAVIGFLTPLTRSLIFGMPMLYPVATCMMFELACYGAVSGLLFHLLYKKTKLNEILIIFIAMVSAILLGRAVYGIVHFLVGVIDTKNSFTFKMFLSGAFVVAWPGIILHLVLVPSLVILLKRSGLLDKFSPQREHEQNQ